MESATLPRWYVRHSFQMNILLTSFDSGVFFLFGAGRLSLCHSQPEEAIKYYTRAIEVQSQHRNLHYISFWEIAIARLALWDLDGSLSCWRDLEKEATWSKATYTYGMAVCLLESPSSTEEDKQEAIRLMGTVPGLRQRIAGKSIPLEVCLFSLQWGEVPFLIGHLHRNLSHAKPASLSPKAIGSPSPLSSSLIYSQPLLMHLWRSLRPRCFHK